MKIYNKENISLINEDCIKVLSKLKEGSVDLIMTDCPYKVVAGDK